MQPHETSLASAIWLASERDQAKAKGKQGKKRFEPSTPTGESRENKGKSSVAGGVGEAKEGLKRSALLLSASLSFFSFLL